MHADARPEAPSKAASALVAHLRQNPQDALREPQALADQFGLSPRFVRSVLDAVQIPRSEEVTARRPAVTLETPRRIGDAAVELFDRMTANPLRFVIFSTLLAISILIALPYIDPIGANSIRDQIREDGTAGFVVLTVLTFHMATYYRHAMTRYALYGGLVVWLGSATAMMISVWIEKSGSSESGKFFILLLVALGMFMLSSVYAGLGCLAAVFGGWVKIRREEIAEERMSRQDLLERFFELQSRLDRGETQAGPLFSWDDWPPVVAFKRHPFLVSFALGLTIEFLQVLLMTVGHLDPANPTRTAASLFVMIMAGIMGLLAFASCIAVGFFAGGPAKAVAAALFFAIGWIPAELLPVGVFGPANFFRSQTLVGLGMNTSVFLVLAAIGAAGANIQARTARQANLQRNDQATLVAEMLRIQWKLADHMTTVCVMVVDAAKSSQMKTEEDPLAVEYSFREYQEWLEEISKGNSGRVHSTAGDGAVVEFPTALDAFRAARRIQTDLERFNREQNRLPAPFRLRIGLHVGQVAGELDEVQFTDVIDIAAHVQGVSPIAGIAATDSVVEQLETEEFIPLAREVDGHKVHLALNPIED